MHRKTQGIVSTAGDNRAGQNPPPSRAEKIKLLATYLNTVASGLMVTGVVGPIANYLYGTVNANSRSSLQLLIEIVILIGAGVCVHIMARKVLERLDQ